MPPPKPRKQKKTGSPKDCRFFIATPPVYAMAARALFSVALGRMAWLARASSGW